MHAFKVVSEIVLASILVLIISLAWFEVYVLASNGVTVFESKTANRVLTAAAFTIFGLLILVIVKPVSMFKEHGEPEIVGDSIIAPEAIGGAGAISLLDGGGNQMAI